MNDILKVGIIQTTLDSNLAWKCTPSSAIQMNFYDAKKLWEEVKDGFIAFSNLPDSQRPQFIVLPEFSIPLNKEKELAEICKKMGAVIIAGLDFKSVDNQVENNAVVLVPQNWPQTRSAWAVNKFYFGKTFFSNEEKKYFEKKDVTGKPFPNVYILDGGDYGNIGVAICADFFDIERFVIYKGRIHHMIVLAYNKDVKSFYFLAEAISRLVYCNVIICNTGYYGGSICFSPYKEEYKRYIYKHEGGKLFAAQVLNLPVSDLDEAQGSSSPPNSKFKSSPPGYVKKNIYGVKEDVEKIYFTKDLK